MLKMDFLDGKRIVACHIIDAEGMSRRAKKSLRSFCARKPDSDEGIQNSF